MTNNPTDDSRPWSVFLIFLRLGLTSFGGPIAHLGYFRAEFVTRRRWLSERSYADLVALCQFLPGPASSQVGIAVGLSRAGYSGALAAWAGFTLPSAIALILFAGTVAKLAMRQPFVLFKGLTFQKLCLPGAFRPGDHHNKMLRPGLCVVHASPQYL
ncbi:chromate transporter [Escherichia coli]|uniref:chromate transporter n=1 Tax=Escherichia coli TaxID=562 RepID=UPI002575B680|nr:chromate transporter [Escherichia coli]